MSDAKLTEREEYSARACVRVCGEREREREGTNFRFPLEIAVRCSSSNRMWQASPRPNDRNGDRLIVRVGLRLRASAPVVNRTSAAVGDADYMMIVTTRRFIYVQSDIGSATHEVVIRFVS